MIQHGVSLFKRTIGCEIIIWNAWIRNILNFVNIIEKKEKIRNLYFSHSNFQRPKSFHLSIVQKNCKIQKYSVFDELSCGQYFSQQVLTSCEF